MKYKEIPTENGLLFPTKSGDKMRRCLKNIAKALNIDREITITRYCGDRRIDETIKMYDAIGTHTARRTFVVHCLEMGWSPDDIMSYTGPENAPFLCAIYPQKRYTFANIVGPSAINIPPICLQSRPTQFVKSAFYTILLWFSWDIGICSLTTPLTAEKEVARLPFLFLFQPT